jgi:hypothetical protein|tara:strand:- start:17531 stop:17887 length:357 start_codon:yes stop_codon:yes gene_type:complete
MIHAAVAKFWRSDVRIAKVAGFRDVKGPRLRRSPHEVQDAAACAETTNDSVGAGTAAVAQGVIAAAAWKGWRLKSALAKKESPAQLQGACLERVLVRWWRISMRSWLAEASSSVMQVS